MNINLNRVLILTAGLVILAIAGILLWQWQSFLVNQGVPGESSRQSEMIDRANELMSAGDYQAALEEASKLLSDSNPSISIRAQRLANEANFLIGTKESRIAAVRGAKDLFVRLEGYPEDQALVIVSLINYLGIASDAYVYEEVFARGPFEAFLVPNSNVDSVKKLAEYSLTLKPTTTALARVGWWYADKILEVTRSYDLDEQAKRAVADEILKIIETRRNLLPQEINAAPSSYMLKTNFYFWQASLYQAVARVYPQYIKEAEESLAALRQEYESNIGQNGKPLATIAVLIPYAELYYAQALFETKGEESLPEVKEHLSALVAVVKTDPETHRGGFIALIESQASLPPRYQIFNHPTYSRFIEETPEFKTFLESYGWSPASN